MFKKSLAVVAPLFFFDGVRYNRQRFIKKSISIKCKFTRKHESFN